MKAQINLVASLALAFTLGTAYSQDEPAFQERRLVTAPNGKFHLDWVEEAELALVQADRPALEPARFPAPRVSEDELIPTAPFVFVSPDNGWVFAAWRQTGYEPATVAELYRLTTGGRAASEFATKERFDSRAWKFLAQNEGIDEGAIGKPSKHDSRPLRDLAFAAWSPDSARLLVSLSAPLGEASDSVLRERGIGSWLCYFNVRTGEFELTDRLRDFNLDACKRWLNQYSQTGRDNFPLAAESVGKEEPWLDPMSRVERADERLNELYKAILKRLPSAAQNELRRQQREWLIQRDTEALIHAHQSWSPAPEAALIEGKAIATESRVAQVEKFGQEAGLNVEIRERSPDGKFAVRYTYAEDDYERKFSIRRAELIELPSEKVVMEFYDAEKEGLSPVQVSVLWAPDSRRFARYFSFKRLGHTTVFQRPGEEFEECELPELDEFRPEAKPGLHERKFYWGAITPERWMSPERLVVKSETLFDTLTESGELGGEVSGKYRLLLGFGKDGKATVKVLSRKVTGPAR